MNTPSSRPSTPVEAWFTASAAHWDELYVRSSVSARVYQRRQARALAYVDRLGLADSAPVLEIGCGAGHASVALAARRFSVVCIDALPSMLALTAANAARAGVTERLRLVRADAQALSFSDGQFAVVLALGVFPWLYAPLAAAAEIARIIAPGGFLIASADNRWRLTHLLDPRLSPLLAPARRFVRQVAGTSRHAAQDPPRVHSPGEFLALLASTGLTPVAHTTCGFGPFTFWGRQVLDTAPGIWLDECLQRCADAGIPPLPSLGSHFLTVFSRRREG